MYSNTSTMKETLHYFQYVMHFKHYLVKIEYGFGLISIILSLVSVGEEFFSFKLESKVYKNHLSCVPIYNSRTPYDKTVKWKESTYVHWMPHAILVPLV